MTTDVLDANIAAFSSHLNAFVDPDLVAIDQELLDGRTDPKVSAQWEAWNAISAALRERLETDAPHLLPLLGDLGDAAGDLHAVSDEAGFARCAALAGAVRSLRTEQDGISAFERFQMTPLGAPDAA